MTILKKLTGSGVPPLAASNMNGDLDNGITATGSTQATAYQLQCATTLVSTAAASTGVVLPSGAPSDDYVVTNFGANTLNVYPPVGGSIDNGTLNAAVTIAANASKWFICVDPAGLKWISK